MSIRVVDRVDGWDQRPFSGGFDTLRDLADDEFSGVVRAGGAELFMTLGTAVAVRHGSIEDFEDASGTVFEAPVPALPLLAVMQEEDVDVRAQYYTEETPISEVDGTLTSGGFTGYVELSENVLSGDYFLVYHGGNSMSVAYVGNSDKLITDDEAFQTADDEVGIYKVRQVDVEPIEIPEDDGDGAAEAAAAAATAEGGAGAVEADPAESTDDASSTDAGEAATDAADADEDGTEPDDQGADDESSAGDDATPDTDTRDEASASNSADSGGVAESDADAADGRETTSTASDTERTSAEAGDPPSETGDRSTETATASATAEAAETGGQRERRETSAASTDHGASARSGDERGTRSGTGGDRSGGSPRQGSTGGEAPRSSSGSSRSASSGAGSQAGDLETRSIPSLDPNKTQTPERPEPSPPTPDPQATQQRASQETRQGAGGTAERAEQDRGPAREQAAEHQATEAQEAPARATEAGAREAADEQPAAGEAGGQSASSEALEELEAELADREAEVERLEGELADAEAANEDLQADLAAVREERDDLAAEVERLEEELGRLEQEFGAATDAEQRMTPSEAIEATNLFVEYDTKGNATLENAHGGSESREEVAENLRLGVHTEFDDRAVAVGGQDFDEFLQNTLHYRFARWVVGDLLFEIRDTGHADYLPDLYDAIPEIRRVEFNGVVDVEYVEDGQEKGGRERFDVIFRHRMGDPLVVANLNDARDPATGNMMTSLVTAAERVGQTEDALASAFLVTSSFFESEALETVSEATKGGLLSRDSRKSFVNLSRKAGYHLCLVAARDGNFHMEVPEL